MHVLFFKVARSPFKQKYGTTHGAYEAANNIFVSIFIMPCHTLALQIYQKASELKYLPQSDMVMDLFFAGHDSEYPNALLSPFR